MNGIYSALMGVFDKNGVNAAGVRALVKHNIEKCGVDGLYVNGSTGENFLMNMRARVEMLQAAAEAARGEVGMIAHIGSPVLEDVYELARAADDLGYDAVSAVTPFYYKFTADEIKGYYRAIADKSRLGVIAYYIPTLSGVTLSPRDLSDILSIDNVIGLKFTSNDMYMLECLRAAHRDKVIFSGFDEMLLSYTVLKTDGAIGSTYNIIGHWAKRVFSAANAGDYDAARATQRHMNAVIGELVDAGLFATLKEVAKLYGVPAGECKPPMSKPAPAQIAAAKRIYEYIEKIDAAAKR